MLPKDNDLGGEEVVERNTPRALRAPKRGAENDEPGAVALVAFVHPSGFNE